ncbi:lysine 2,3-aminomutase [uncultured Bacteroides sp.]|uniref:lysine 2,3-aminomutase n=1 Tax=uncultured Bacteroides sp. TaxID=162156 RepID=UPI0025E28474|nr:lysine 2,3-aminomutase [uncultured Bacteroides sp.]
MVYNKRQQEITKKIDSEADISDWTNWKWQLRHSIKTLEQFEYLTGIEFDEQETEQLRQTFDKFPLSITPYYLSLIQRGNYRNDPVFKQAFGSPEELITLKSEYLDPLSEDKDSPVEGITHRYPDRVLFHVSNVCAMYCRHCTRKRKVGDVDSIPSKSQLTAGIEYIKRTPQVKDVLLSGGDPLMLSNEILDWLLSELIQIPHVQVLRIGTRMPVVLPYRITDQLVSILKKYQPLWINTHFNHPNEVTGSSREALAKLADGGFPLGNQSVLLARINDCPKIMKSLVHKLIQNRVRPYYLYQCDLSEGLSHFRTPVGKGIEIMESLIGHTSGFARPTFVIDAPGGGGKIPVMPNYVISRSVNKLVLRNYEGIMTTYIEPDDYQSTICNNDCDKCTLQVVSTDTDDFETIGIEKLLSDANNTISLIPEDNERIQRRNE